MCDVEISRSLAARVGTHEAHVSVQPGDTVRGVIERLAEEYGSQVETGILDGERLRSDVIAIRKTAEDEQPVTASTALDPGDALEFHLTSEHEKVSNTA